MYIYFNMSLVTQRVYVRQEEERKKKFCHLPFLQKFPVRSEYLAEAFLTASKHVANAYVYWYVCL